MKKKVLVIPLTILLFALFSISVSAVGLSSWGSVVKEMDFIPGTQQTYAYMLRTTTDFTQDYELKAEGDLAHLITFAPSNVLKNIAPGQDPWFNVIVNFPASESNITPGLHTILVGVLESSSGGGMVGGRTAVNTRFMVRVLDPGKFLKASLDAPDVNINEPVRLSLHLENWGKIDIYSAQAQINVYTQEKEFKDTISSDTVSVPGAGQVDTYAVLDTLNYPPGDYYAEGIVTWDGQQTPVNDTFKIGIQDIKMNTYTATFEKDKINPFILNIESLWNSPTEDVYAVIELPNGKIQTPTITLSPWENTNLSTYWDTTSVEVGKYDAKINLHYANQSKSQDVKVEVLEKVEAQEQKPLGFNYFYILLIVVILILINLVLWIFFLRKKKEQEPQNI